tara:strand:- start:900 stop:1646 length:747 start_codon:yes stop_codon:yes gene_type:complete
MGILATYFSAEAAAGRAARKEAKITKREGVVAAKRLEQEGVIAARDAQIHGEAIKVKSENYKSSVKALDESVASMEGLVGDLSKTARSVALGALVKEGVTGEALNKLVKDGALAPDPIHEEIKGKIIEAISGHRDLVEDFVSKADDAGVDGEKARDFVKGHSDTVSAVADAAADHTHDESFADRIRRTAARIQAVIDRVMSAIHRMGPTDSDSAALDTENSTATNDDVSPVSEPEPVAVSDDNFSPSN